MKPLRKWRLTMSKQIYIGIDNGLDGALAANMNGKIISRTTMLTVMDGVRRKVDVKGVRNWIRKQMIWTKNICVVIEKPCGSKNAYAAKSMADSFARIESCVILDDLKYYDISAISWQRHFWKKPKMPKSKKFDTKAAAITVAMKIWPNTDWRANDRCRKPHDGIVDAALIAEYARLKKL